MAPYEKKSDVSISNKRDNTLSVSFICDINYVFDIPIHDMSASKPCIFLDHENPSDIDRSVEDGIQNVAI